MNSFVRMGRKIVFWMACMALAAPLSATASEVRPEYSLRLDDQVFSVVFPSPPEREFAKYLFAVSLRNEELFAKSERVECLKVHWTFRNGLFRKVAGVLEVKVLVQAASSYDVSSLEELKKQLHADFARDLTRVGYSGGGVKFQHVVLNGRTWLKYQVPILGVVEYTTSLSSNRLLTMQFAFIDNTGEESHAWYQEANSLGRGLTESMLLR
jgi:hypothetical protein